MNQVNLQEGQFQIILQQIYPIKYITMAIKRWVLAPARQPKQKVPESAKSEAEKRCNEFVESVLKPKYVVPHPKNEDSVYVADIYIKWHGNNFLFCAKYIVPGPNAISPFFEEKFARIEYVSKDKFNLSYMRHTGKWFEIFTEISLDECMDAIKNMPDFML